MAATRNEQLAQYRKEAFQQFMLSEGWKELLAHIMSMLTGHDAALSNPALPAPVRDMAVGQRLALTGLVAWIAHQADRANPFDTARGALWSQLRPPDLPIEALPTSDIGPLPSWRERLERLQRHQGGGVV
jgi:hypothetical protein